MTNTKAASSLPIPVLLLRLCDGKHLKKDVFTAELTNIFCAYTVHPASFISILGEGHKHLAYTLKAQTGINSSCTEVHSTHNSFPALFCDVHLGWPEEVSASPAQVRWHDPWPADPGSVDSPANGFWDHLGPAASPWKQLHPQVSHAFHCSQYQTKPLSLNQTR